MPFRSPLLDFLKGNTDVLEKLVVEMCARGLSTRDIEDAFRDATGERLLTKTAASQIADSLWEEYEAFAARDLSDLDVEYLFLDGVSEQMRPTGTQHEMLLIAWAHLGDGSKVLLHMTSGSSESEAAWQAMLEDMRARGLRDPVMYTTDGAPGLIAAARAAFPQSLRQRCLAHKMRNILAKVPVSDQAAVKEAVSASFYALLSRLPKRPPPTSWIVSRTSSRPPPSRSPTTSRPAGATSGVLPSITAVFAPPTPPKGRSRRSGAAPRSYRGSSASAAA
jgi:transposase-like protein